MYVTLWDAVYSTLRSTAQRSFGPFGGQAGGGGRGGGGSPLLSFSLALPTLRTYAVPHPTPGKVVPLAPSFVLAVCNFFSLSNTLSFFHIYSIIYFSLYLKK